jgi:toxin ParE1/3/4
MSGFRVQDKAGHRLDEIYRYTHDTWGQTQAESYIRGLFERFQAIADRRVAWRPIAAEFGVDGYICRYAAHFVYWKILSNGEVGIVTVLHQRMHQLERFRDDASL